LGPAARAPPLPTATVFRLLPATYRVWDAALFLPHGMLAIAGLAALFSWLAVIPGLNTEGQRRCQARIARFWRVAGFPTLVLVLLFLLSGGGWSGRFSPFEMHYLSLGGLVPYSDAHDYYAAPFEAIYSGHWNDTAGHRPMAAATGSLVVALGGYSYSGALIVQTIIIGLAIGVCVGSLARSYGLWVALGFTGLAIGLARPFSRTRILCRSSAIAIARACATRLFTPLCWPLDSDGEHVHYSDCGRRHSIAIRGYDERPIEVVGERRGHPRWHLRHKFCLRRDVRVGRQDRGNLCLYLLWTRPWHGLVGVLADVLCPTL